ncbi:MAG: hypothetical protein OEY01_12195 [Desulfobulbaceae bacterium]|nr:hypothetical protein [Desulfobulbaceae bacterium]
MSIEEQRKKVLDEKFKVSSRISDLSRYIGFGLVAIVYTILTSDSVAITKLYGNKNTLILVAACLGAVTIVLDYVQFLAGYFSVQEALENEAGQYKYNNQSIAYTARNFAFWAKQTSALFGAIIFGVSIVLPFVCA